MPVTTYQLTASGLRAVPHPAESLKAAADHEPGDGVYTVANAQQGTGALKLTAHLTRLQDSAQREGIALTLTPEQIRAALRQAISGAGYAGDVKFRITVPRHTPNHIYISLEPFGGYPAHNYTDGVKVITAANSARHNPAAKDSAWMHDRKAIEDALPANVHTAILLDGHGNLLEGTSSNFYAIMNDTLYTAQDGVLPGTAQQIVLEVAPGVLPVERQPVNMADVPRLQEAFITSSSRGVMPVTQIDDVVLNNGSVGPFTLSIRDAYQQWVNAHLEVI
jgi:branched-chain amino acid aminotransferase